MNTITRKFAWRLIAGFATVLAWAGAAAAQTVVVGTGDPDVDVPAVQAAVDQGGEVILQGHFSFDRPPTVPMAQGTLATVLVSRAVAISGAWGEDGEMTTIEGGTRPFYVQAPGASVEIRRVRFIHPTADAIFVYSVSGLVIASCKIEGVNPSRIGGRQGIEINTSGNPPVPSNPGTPETVSGTLLVVNNDIDVGGTALQNTLGILIFSVGVPGAEVEVYVSRNTIRNTTEPAINFRRIVGRAYIERNVITTGSVVGSAPTPQAIRVAYIGSYLIAHNSIDVGWPRADAEGIGMSSEFAAWPMEGAIVVDNDVTMSAPEGTVFGDFSAGISIMGFAQGNVVLGNRIRGRARAALSISVFPNAPQSVPTNNAFVLNRFDHFEPSVADISVGASAMNTLIVGGGTVEDHGVGAIIVPVPPKGDHDEDRHDEGRRRADPAN